MNALAAEANRNAAVNDAGPANDVALQVTLTDEFDNDRTVDGLVTLHGDDDATVVIPSADELTPRELKTAYEKLLDAADSLRESNRLGDEAMAMLRRAE